MNIRAIGPPIQPQLGGILKIQIQSPINQSSYLGVLKALDFRRLRDLPSVTNWQEVMIQDSLEKEFLKKFGTIYEFPKNKINIFRYILKMVRK